MRPYNWGDQPLQKITITTRHPEDYVLINRADHTAWAYDEKGKPHRIDWRKEYE